MAEGTGMETIILIGIAVIILIGIAVIAFLLWQIKKAIDKLEANRRKLNLGPSLKLTAQGAGAFVTARVPPMSSIGALSLWSPSLALLLVMRSPCPLSGTTLRPSRTSIPLS